MNGLELIRQSPSDKPWSLQVNFAGPHSPWDITQSMAELYRGVPFPQPNRNNQLPPETHNAIRENYSAMVENIDRWLGIFLEELEKRDELNRTLIVFSSDHGEMLGDHNRWSKSLPYHPSVGVPLVTWGTGVQNGAVSELPTTILDLTATFLEYAGIPVPDEMDSRSLKPLLEGKTETHREYVISGLGDWCMVFDGQYKCIKGFGDTPLLFDLKADPLENHNLANAIPDEAVGLMQLLSG